MNLDLSRLSFLTNLFFIVLLSAIFWSGWLLVPDIAGRVMINQSIGTAFGDFIDSKIVQIPILGVVTSVLLMILNALMVTRLCIKNVIFFERSYMPALIYTIICIGFFNSYLSLLPLLVSTLLIVASGLIFKSYNIKNLATGTYLKIGFYFGLAAAIYAPAICFFPLLIIALFSFRLFRLREWIAAIVGYALPLFFLMYVGWMCKMGFEATIQNYIQALLIKSKNMPTIDQVNILEWGLISTITTLIILSFMKFIGRRKAYNTKAFKSYLFFVWMLLITIAMIVWLPSSSLSLLPIMATSLAVIIAAYFNASKPSFLMNFLYALLICEVVAIHIVPKLLLF